MRASGKQRILHVTDLHLHASIDTELYGVRTDDSFRSVIDKALHSGRAGPTAVLVTGDIAEDRSRRAYERFRSVMRAIPTQVLCLPGNHDDPELARQVLNAGNLSYCPTVDLGAWRLVLLDSHLPGDEGGALSDAELRRLEAALEGCGDRHVLVAVHHQPIDMGSAWLDGYGMRNAPAFLSLVAGFGNVRAVLWGHVHQASDREYRGIRMLSTPSTCAQFTPGTASCVMDTRPPGFRTLELHADGRIDTEVVWLDEWVVAGRPPDSRQSPP